MPGLEIKKKADYLKLINILENPLVKCLRFEKIKLQIFGKLKIFIQLISTLYRIIGWREKWYQIKIWICISNQIDEQAFNSNQ